MNQIIHVYMYICMPPLSPHPHSKPFSIPEMCAVLLGHQHRGHSLLLQNVHNQPKAVDWIILLMWKKNTKFYQMTRSFEGFNITGLQIYVAVITTKKP